MAEADEWGTVADFERSLREQGLHVVTAAEKARLDALDAVPADVLDDWRAFTVHVRHIPACHDLAVAVLARRKATP